MGAPRVNCPTCRRELDWSAESPWRPFCSERCRMIDLGAWLAGERSIAGEPAALDENGEPVPRERET